MTFNYKTIKEELIDLDDRGYKKQLKVAILQKDQNQYIEIRQYEDYNKDGTPLPTKKGIFVNAEFLPDILKSLLFVAEEEDIKYAVKEFQIRQQQQQQELQEPTDKEPTDQELTEPQEPTDQYADMENLLDEEEE